MRPLFWADQCQDEVVALAGAFNPLTPHMFDQGTAAGSDTKEERLNELRELNQILKQSAECGDDYACEAAWNEDVHRPVLRLAVESYTGVKSRNVYARQHAPFPISYATD
jgi:hypothetical protein